MQVKDNLQPPAIDVRADLQSLIKYIDSAEIFIVDARKDRLTINLADLNGKNPCRQYHHAETVRTEKNASD